MAGPTVGKTGVRAPDVFDAIGKSIRIGVPGRVDEPVRNDDPRLATSTGKEGVSLPFSDERYAFSLVGTVQEVLHQWEMNWDLFALAPGHAVGYALALLAKQFQTISNGRIQVFIGGSDWAADGTMIIDIDMSSGPLSYTQFNIDSTFTPKPSGVQLIKIVAQCPGGFTPGAEGQVFFKSGLLRFFDGGVP